LTRHHSSRSVRRGAVAVAALLTGCLALAVPVVQAEHAEARGSSTPAYQRAKLWVQDKLKVKKGSQGYFQSKFWAGGHRWRADVRAHGFSKMTTHQAVKALKKQPAGAEAHLISLDAGNQVYQFRLLRVHDTVTVALSLPGDRGSLGGEEAVDPNGEWRGSRALDPRRTYFKQTRLGTKVKTRPGFTTRDPAVVVPTLAGESMRGATHTVLTVSIDPATGRLVPGELTMRNVFGQVLVTDNRPGSKPVLASGTGRWPGDELLVHAQFRQTKGARLSAPPMPPGGETVEDAVRVVAAAGPGRVGLLTAADSRQRGHAVLRYYRLTNENNVVFATELNAELDADGKQRYLAGKRWTVTSGRWAGAEHLVAPAFGRPRGPLRL
jgi:hypothetical protein